jgi:nucleoside-diphosphate-sugar epimerase
MLHVVFGAGQIGSELARALVARGNTVRVVRRSQAAVGEGIEVVAGDAMDPAFARRVTEGAAVVYHCMNPSAYTKEAWSTEFPKFGESLIQAAIANHASLVVLDNLYAYGLTEGTRTEETPRAATGPKGQVRIAWEQRLREAAEKEGLRFVVGRGGDFFGPGTSEQSLFSPAMVEGLRKGKSAWLIGASDAVHAFSFVPDVVQALVAFGAAEPDVEGQIFHLPVIEVAPAELVERLAKAVGSSARAHTLPAWALSALAPIVPLFKNLQETLYQWDRPFRVSDAKLRARFPGVGSTLEEAVNEMATSTTRTRPVESQPSA